ncbi:uncharacterized protein LOC134683598 [Mytilus trossulus]|uniref:uncharacterized protein LOC134683598 n=1 Tax=Mytilus trossulus TaxID=6551 RepID=UPI003005808C
MSSCTFDFMVEELGCTVPESDDSTIKGSSPNSTYYVSNKLQKICKQGYDLQPGYPYDFARVKCVEIIPGYPEWKDWYSRNCSKNEIPKICGREVKLDGKETNAVYFTYNPVAWKGLIEQNITSCKFGALLDVKNPSMYDLEITFHTDTSSHLTADKCFFEILLFAGNSTLSTPIKKFDCTIKGSVKIKWPTLYFTLVFRVFDSFKSQQHTDLTGNGTILFTMTECSNCALSDLTGLNLIESQIPIFKFYPFRPCRMDGCLEDSLQMFKLKGAPNTWDELSELKGQKACTANIEVQSNTKTICFKQVYQKRNYDCRQYVDMYLNIFIHLDSFFTLVIKCDDLQGWWCLPQDLPKFENLTITWDVGRLFDVETDEFWVLSASTGNNNQACSQPIIYTTPTPGNLS